MRYKLENRILLLKIVYKHVSFLLFLQKNNQILILAENYFFRLPIAIEITDYRDRFLHTQKSF